MKQAPHVALRIADCYTKLGNSEKSRKSLESLIAMPVPQPLKDNAQLALANLKNKKNVA